MEKEKYSYAANGNLVKEQLGDLSAEYEYNYNNRLVRARNNSNYPYFFNSGRPFKGEVRYKYDALNRKIEKTVDPLRGAWQETQRYMYDGKTHNMIEGYEIRVRRKGNNGRGRRKGRGNAGKLNKITEYYQAEGNLIAMNYFKKPKISGGWWPKHPNKGLNFYHKDSLGSVAMTTGRNGQAVERYEYDAYGDPYNGWYEHSAHNQNPFGFTGQRYSNQLGTWNFAYRHYNSNTMRWMTVDPVKDGTNWYQYVNADPVNMTDVLGLYADENPNYRGRARILSSDPNPNSENYLNSYSEYYPNPTNSAQKITSYNPLNDGISDEISTGATFGDFAIDMYRKTKAGAKVVTRDGYKVIKGTPHAWMKGTRMNPGTFAAKLTKKHIAKGGAWGGVIGAAGETIDYVINDKDIFSAEGFADITYSAGRGLVSGAIVGTGTALGTYAGSPVAGFAGGVYADEKLQDFEENFNTRERYKQFIINTVNDLTKNSENNDQDFRVPSLSGSL